jgi:N-acetylmuramoyl-L-alanine amidase
MTDPNDIFSSNTSDESDPDASAAPRRRRAPWKPANHLMPDDDFQRRTIDTGSFEVVDAGEGTTALPRPAEEDEAGEDDEFQAVTIEPGVEVRKPVQAPPRPVRHRVSTARRARTRVWLSTILALLASVGAAMIVSTIFSLWTRPTFFSDEFRVGLNQVRATQQLVNIQPSPIPTNVLEVRIGIVAGHSGKPQDPQFELDPGAVCADGLTELEINMAVAQRVVASLRRDGYTVDDPLTEFDSKLENYQADVLVSIHTNDCGDYGPAGTGYNAASALSRRSTRGADEALLECLIQEYGATTNLPRHDGITVDMTEYHTFAEVSPDTPTAIIELGFMRLDRAILTQNPDLLAEGIANGIRCFLRPKIGPTPVEAAAQAGQ